MKSSVHVEQDPVISAGLDGFSEEAQEVRYRSRLDTVV